jgi:hypothetical protein
MRSQLIQFGMKMVTGVPERASYVRESDACVSAGGFGDAVSGVQAAFGVGLADDRERHPVFDAASEVHLLAFGMDGALAAQFRNR